MIREFEWHRLFWQHRRNLEHHLYSLVFGHAIYEKAIHPYIGLTAKAILIEVDSDFRELSGDQQLAYLDSRVSEIFTPPTRLASPRDLCPFPILGMPGYFPGNDREEFFLNRDYFRAKPAKHPPA